MKNFWLIILSGALFVGLGAGCVPPADENNDEVENNQAWETYTNPMYNYSFDYPTSWFYADDACCPPPPSYVVFNNISNLFFEFSEEQSNPQACSFNVSCGYEGALSDIGEVQYYLDEGVAYESKFLNGFDAALFPDGTYYVVDGTNGCRLESFGSCSELADMVRTFSF